MTSLQYMYDELLSPDRKFTFLVGHDSNIASVAVALRVAPYDLPNAIEKKTPIGSKLVIIITGKSIAEHGSFI